MGIPSSSGIIHCVSSGALGAAEVYVNIYKYLTSLSASAFGVQLYASNNGLNFGGTGNDYPDTANYVGNNAWSVFKWSQANTPFYVLVQYGTGTFGASPGNPGMYSKPNNDTTTYNNGGVGVQIAMRPDGSSPWNGTSNADGSDTKSDPVWIDNGNNELYVWPRPNGISSSNSTKKELCLSIASQYNVNAGKNRMNVILDKENVAFNLDSLGNAGSYECLWFGRYNQYSSSYSASTVMSISCPYAMTWNYFETNVDPLYPSGSNNVFGTLNPSGTLEGGVAHPDPKKGVVGVSVDTINTMFTLGGASGKHPNYKGDYVALPLQIFMNETIGPDNCMGLLGQSSDFIRYIYGCATGDTSMDKLWCVFGGTTTTANSSKLLFPWDGVTTPEFTTTVGSRSGVIY